jgi:hypothetical protein
MQLFVVIVAAFCLGGGSLIGCHNIYTSPNLGSNFANDMQDTGDARCARCGPETMKTKGRDEVGEGKMETLFCLIDS